MRRSAALLAVLLFACTPDSNPTADQPATAPGSSSVTPSPAPASTIALVIADEASSYIEGVRFAAQQEPGIELIEAASISDALAADPAAVVVVGDASGVATARPAIEDARTAVVAVGGDLYTPKQMFRYAFQTSVPVRWQARVLAGYFLEDRHHASTALVSAPAENRWAGEAFNTAWNEEGEALDRIVALVTPKAFRASGATLLGVDSVAFVGSTAQAAMLSRGFPSDRARPQLALSSEGLDPGFVTRNQPTPGTVVCYPYSWSGWADMLPRVHRFREQFAAAMDHYPASLEQEGFDAVKTLADALERTGGVGGDPLVRELETFREEIYSSMPVRLGPDDHVFAEQSQLGLFAIEEPADEALPEGEASSLVAWRPIMRTFTTDGEKVNLLDRDKRIFFPFWRPKAPSPKYWRSEYGIVSRPSDPLH